jgi:hypothetical protein
MIIDSSSIQLYGRHQLQQSSTETESLRIWITEPREVADNAQTSPDKTTPSVETTQASEFFSQSDAVHSLTAQIVKRMVKAITGRDFKLFNPEHLKADTAAVEYQEKTTRQAETTRSGFALVYQRTASYQESENTTFSAQGTVKTRDGKEIEISSTLSMSREFSVSSSFTLRAGDAVKIDPLVINFDGNAAELSEKHFEFDLDADGKLDHIAVLNPGSAMLALDKNRDGKINDGSELFGPQSGNGFNELAQYDEDHNLFIDEADSIYKQLRIWQRHEDGSQQLLALGEIGIGAIYLGHTSTPFQLKSSDNSSLGEITDSGVYLTEQGGVGTIQQINFTA